MSEGLISLLIAKVFYNKIKKESVEEQNERAKLLLEDSKRKVESYIKQHTPSGDPYNDLHRAYPKEVNGCYEIAFKENTTTRVSDGLVYHGAKSFHSEATAYVNEIYDENKDYAFNAFSLTYAKNMDDLATYMAMDTIVFRYIYNEIPIRAALSFLDSESRHSDYLEGFSNKIYSTEKCSIDDLWFIHGFDNYVRHVMKNHLLDEFKACGVAWGMMRRVLAEFYMDKWKNSFYSPLFARKKIDTKDGDQIIRNYLLYDSEDKLEYESLSSLAFYLIGSGKSNTTSFPDTVAYILKYFHELHNEISEKYISGDFEDIEREIAYISDGM